MDDHRGYQPRSQGFSLEVARLIIETEFVRWCKNDIMNDCGGYDLYGGIKMTL